MNSTLLGQTSLYAISIGLGCGACCTPQISSFLSLYVISHGKGIASFAKFFIGKALAIILACQLSSILGRQLIEESGLIGKINVALFSQCIILLIGISLTMSWIFKENKRKSTSGCGGCKNNISESISIESSPKNGLHILAIGFAYGITPCLPMFLIMGQATLLSWSESLVLGTVFAASSSLSPTLVLVALSGILAVKMKEEISQYIKWFQLGCYVFLCMTALVNIIIYYI